MAVSQNRFRSAEAGTPMSEVSRNMSNLAADAFELSELQIKLLRNDLNRFRGVIWLAVWMVPMALGLAIAGLPVVAFALAGTLAKLLDWDLYICQWIIGALFFVLAAVLGYVAARAVARSLKSFAPSQRELVRNMQWLRQMISSQPTDPNTVDYTQMDYETRRASSQQPYEPTRR